MATDWRSNDFKKARIKLTLLYSVIFALILITFSVALNFQTKNSFSQLKENIQISESKAIQIAKSERPNMEISDISFEEEDGKLNYNVQYSDGYEIKIDPFSGSLYLENETLKDSYLEFFQDFQRTILLLAGVIFFLSMVLSYFLAGKTLKPIETKMLQQKQFTADAAHELRNPLAAIHASAESFLRNKKTPQKETESIFKDIMSESKRLIVMSEDLMSLAKSESALISLQNVDLSKIINSVIKKTYILLKNKKIKMESNIVNNVFIKGDLNDLESIIFNLIHNAIKFSPRNSSIEINLSKDKILRIKDEGHGISKKDLPHIFDRFYKADKSRAFDEEGSGLGLSIVKNIAMRHGATVSVESESGKGTEFIIIF